MFRTGSVAGTVTIDGADHWITSPVVTLALDASETVDEMCISTMPTCQRWVPFATQHQMVLRATSAPQTISAWFRDASGAVSDAATLVVQLDRSGPVGETPHLEVGPGSLSLTWAPFEDAGAGLFGYAVVGAVDGPAPRCSQGEPWWEGDATATTAVLTGLAAQPTAVRLCAYDKAGNIGFSRALSGTPEGESVAPEIVSFVINGDDATSRFRDVVLNIDATDASGVRRYCASERVDNAADCPVWRPFAAAVDYELSGGPEEKTVRVWVEDPHGNRSEAAVDTIVFDHVMPANGTVSATVDGDAVALTWSGYVDAVSGVDEYIVVRGDDVAPRRCTEGEEVYRGSETSLTLTGLAEQRHGFRVCAWDEAGNLSDGSTVRVTVVPPVVPPVVDDFFVDGHASEVCEPSIHLTLEAQGPATITRMCIDEDGACAQWIPYSEHASLELSPEPGQKTLFARVRDADGEESEVAAMTEVTLVDCGAPVLHLSAAAVDLGAICATAAASIDVSNDGDAPLTLQRGEILNDGAAAWTSADLATFPWVLAPGEQRTIQLQATPGTATLVLTHDAEGGTVLPIPLAAQADLPPMISLGDIEDDADIGGGEVRAWIVEALDDETDPLTVTWTSSVDGLLDTTTTDGDGRARTVWSASDATPGSHRVTVTATDACGQTDSVQFSVCQDNGYAASTFDAADWVFAGSAQWDTVNGWLELTSTNANEAGGAFFLAQTFDARDIDVSMKVYLSGGTGGSGLAITALTAEGAETFVGSSGQGLGYEGMSGWTVELDTEYNRGIDPTSQDHVALHFNGDIDSASSYRGVADLEDGRWHDLRIRVEERTFKVTLDGEDRLEKEVRGRGHPVYIGLTAATGTSTNRHLVDDFRIAGSVCGDDDREDDDREDRDDDREDDESCEDDD